MELFALQISENNQNYSKRKICVTVWNKNNIFENPHWGEKSIKFVMNQNGLLTKQKLIWLVFRAFPNVDHFGA